MTLTAMRPDLGLLNGREVSLLSVAQASWNTGGSGANRGAGRPESSFRSRGKDTQELASRESVGTPICGHEGQY